MFNNDFTGWEIICDYMASTPPHCPFNTLQNNLNQVTNELQTHPNGSQTQNICNNVLQWSMSVMWSTTHVNRKLMDWSEWPVDKVS